MTPSQAVEKPGKRDYAKDCQAVLKALSDSRYAFEGGPGYLYFRTIQKRTGMPRSRVRVICRALKRKGLAEYGMGLMDEDGQFAGAGYAITDAGLRALGPISDRDRCAPPREER